MADRSNAVNFNLTRGEGTRGKVTLTCSGLPARSSSAPVTIDDGVKEGTITFRLAADAPQADLAIALDGALVDSAAKATASVSGFIRGAPGALDTTFATKGSVACAAI